MHSRGIFNGFSRVLAAILICLGLLAGLPAPARADTLTVDTNLDEADNDCLDGDCSLRDAINTSAPGNTIVFDEALSGQTITLVIGQLDIDRDLVIDASALAEKVTISGNHIYRVLGTHGPVQVTLRNLVIRDGTSSDGYGGAGIHNEGDLTLSGCLVTGNTTGENGGGIYNMGKLTVNENSQITHNSAGYGGGIRNDGTLTILNSSLLENQAYFGGGIDNYNRDGSMSLSWVNLERNSAVYYGGAITTSAPAYIGDSTLRENSAQSGGGIDSHEPDVSLVVERSTLYGNTAEVDGGALLNDWSSVEIYDSTFEANSAGTQGGAIYNHSAGVVSLNGSYLVNNLASGAGAGWGGGICNEGEFHILGSSLTGNQAALHGGGILNWGGTLTIEDSVFEANSAQTYGGAIGNDSYGSLSVRHSTFRENQAQWGGGIANDNSSSVEIIGSTFEGNQALDSFGGGIGNGVGTVTVSNTTFYNNQAALNGGGVHNHEGTLTLDNVTFFKNGSVSGGGLSNGDAGTLYYRNTLIAGSSSGADCANGGTLAENIHNLVEDGSCYAAWSGYAGLTDLADHGGATWTCALLPDSPAIDIGDNATCKPDDQRGWARDDWNCDLGAYELKFTDSNYVWKTISEAGVYTFGPTRVKVEIIDPGALTSLQVARYDGDHAGRTGSGLGNGTGWGEYFDLSPNSGANGTFEAVLTLPALFTPDSLDRVCRFISGQTWDCDSHLFGSSPFNFVTRMNVNGFSEWAIGGNVGPTAVQFLALQAETNHPAGYLVGILAGLIGVVVVLMCRLFWKDHLLIASRRR